MDMLLKFILRFTVLGGLLAASAANATGILPETSVVIVEEADGEGSINLKNTDSYPVLLLTTILDIRDDHASLLTATPPAARVEPGKVQSVRFLLTDKTPLKTERLKRVTFEGIPPQKQGQNEVRMMIRQNLPVLIRPAGLARDAQPWKRLVWRKTGQALQVSNPSAYVVRLSQQVVGQPGNQSWTLPEAYILPDQTITLSSQSAQSVATLTKVTLSPATTWGYTVNEYTADITN